MQWGAQKAFQGSSFCIQVMSLMRCLREQSKEIQSKEVKMGAFQGQKLC